MQVFAIITALFLLIPAPQTISVTVNSTRAEGGEVRLAVYANAADFAAKREVASAVRPRKVGAVAFDLSLPKAGTYVIAAFHDLNGNGKLDRNMFGIPTEPYGFSREPTSKWKAPVFGEVASQFDGGMARADLRLKLWKEY